MTSEHESEKLKVDPDLIERFNHSNNLYASVDNILSRKTSSACAIFSMLRKPVATNMMRLLKIRAANGDEKALALCSQIDSLDLHGEKCAGTERRHSPS